VEREGACGDEPFEPSLAVDVLSSFCFSVKGMTSSGGVALLLLSLAGAQGFISVGLPSFGGVRATHLGFISVGPPSFGGVRATQSPPALSRRSSSHHAVLALRASQAAEMWRAACEENGVPAPPQPLPLEDVKALLSAAMAGDPKRAETFAEVGGGRGEVSESKQVAVWGVERVERTRHSHVPRPRMQRKHTKHAQQGTEHSGYLSGRLDRG